jgi:predicted DNA-binding protein (MmcQ/YjbR family)
VREVCLSLPEAEEKPSRGSPDFRVRGKTFATFVVNHHGDGQIALWLRAPDGAQEFFVHSEPDFFFVPPYVGPRGWLGLRLDRGLDWDRIAEQVHDAYLAVAPASLAAQAGPPSEIDPPTETMDPVDFDPLNAARAQELVPLLAARCLALPETNEGDRFGHKVWRAGKKSFCAAEHQDGRLWFTFWVGREMQPALTADPRFRVPAYTGHNGWILLDVEQHVDWDQVDDLLLASYRHFALKRMLKSLDDGDRSTA